MENRELLWLELMKYYGLAEIPGPVDNEVIVKWFHELGFDVDDDETAWCSLTINIMAKNLGLPYTGKLDARSWMKIGTQIFTEPKIGHITVFWRGERYGWQGHVGLFAGFNKEKDHIYTLGGNQGNMIGIRAYPVNSPTFGLLGYREI